MSDASTTNLRGQTANWLFQQGPQTVLLFLILVAIAIGSWYGVPGLVEQIKDGYRGINDTNLKARAEADARHAETIAAEQKLREWLLEQVFQSRPPRDGVTRAND